MDVLTDGAAEKQCLDATCGSRMMWFDKQDTRALFIDNRQLETQLCDGRKLSIDPDMMADFRSLPFDDGTFDHVVFDPPHLVKAGEKSWLAQKYGKLGENWREDLRSGFTECFRVLREGGTLVFKWNETQITVSQIMKLSPVPALYGHRSGKQAKTHWIVFVKPRTTAQKENKGE